jgi:hypothetical protein
MPLLQVGADPRGPWAHQYGATPAYQRYKAGLWQGNLWGLSRHWGRLKERAALLKVDLLQPKAGTHALLPLGPLAQVRGGGRDRGGEGGAGVGALVPCTAGVGSGPLFVLNPQKNTKHSICLSCIASSDCLLPPLPHRLRRP